MLLFLCIFFCIGCIFGSFATVLIARWHSGKGGIIGGRSECPSCHHILGGLELIPVISYLIGLGRCHHCRAHISSFYPLSEIVMGLIFASMGYTMITLDIDIISMKSILLLFFGFVTGVYILYDLRYMEIPDQIMVPAIGLLLVIAISSILFSGNDMYTFHTFHISITDRLFGAFVLYTFFYFQILIPGSIFLIQRHDWRHLRDLYMSYIYFPFFLLRDFFWRGKKIRSKDESNDLEIPTWIGGGDLRIALFIGLTLGTLHGIVSFAFAYILGSIIGISILIVNQVRGRQTDSQIPFGPFLGIGWILAVVLYIPIVYIYTIYYI